MAKCSGCGNMYYLMQTSICSKCESLEGLETVAERAEPQSKPQCLVCGNVYKNLPRGEVCQTCTWELIARKADPNSSFPVYLLGIPAVSQLVFPGPGEGSQSSLGTLVSQITTDAVAFQQIASNTRLGNARPPNTNLVKAISAGKKIIQERKEKKDQFNKQATGIKITAGLWSAGTFKGAKRGPMVLMVPNISTVYSPLKSIESAFGDLVRRLQTVHAAAFPQARNVYLSDVKIHAHVSKSSSILLDDISNIGETVQDLYSHFVKQRHISRSAAVNSIEIRFVYLPEDILPSDDDDEDLYAGTGKRKASHMAGPATRTSSRRPAPVLMSAYRAITSHPVAFPSAPAFARNPPFNKYIFTCTTAACRSDGSVNFTTSDIPQEILVGADWREGQKLCRAGKPRGEYSGTGFVGEGYTKEGIYMQIGGEEFVITQIADPNDTDFNSHKVLLAELELLVKGAYMKAAFDHYAEECKVSVPKFYFNAAGAMVGKLILDDKGHHDGGIPVIATRFLATRFCPSGQVDRPVRKFTGNDVVGEASDSMTQAIHAFAHFTLVYSSDEILFADLQGLCDAKGVMCLIDPQCHTKSKNENSTYWDKGESSIKVFKKEHSQACGDNWVCNGLSLRTVKAQVIGDDGEDDSGSVSSSSAPIVVRPGPKSKRKGPLRIGFSPEKKAS